MHPISLSHTRGTAAPTASGSVQGPGLSQRPTRPRQAAGPHLLQRGARAARGAKVHSAGTAQTDAKAHAEANGGTQTHSTHSAYWEQERLQAQLASHQALSESLQRAQEGLVDSVGRQLETMKILQR